MTHNIESIKDAKNQFKNLIFFEFYAKMITESEAICMPTLSMFFGIIIRMFKEVNSNHHLPHFHAEYGEYVAVFDFDGNIIEGTMPKRQQKFISAWAELHKEELEANWKLLCDGEPFFKIDPLR